MSCVVSGSRPCQRAAGGRATFDILLLLRRIGGLSPWDECHRWQSRAQPLKAVAPVRRQAAARPSSAVTSASIQRDRLSAPPADVPGAELCLYTHQDMSAPRTTPTPGNRRALPFKAGQKPGSRPSIARAGRSLSSRSLPLTALLERRCIGAAARWRRYRRPASRVHSVSRSTSAPGTRWKG